MRLGSTIEVFIIQSDHEATGENGHDDSKRTFSMAFSRNLDTSVNDDIDTERDYARSRSVAMLDSQRTLTAQKSPLSESFEKHQVVSRRPSSALHSFIAS